MPHFLIEITTSAAATEEIKEDPRSYLERVRAAAAELGGHLGGCWFTGGGNRVVAFLHLDHPEHRTTVQYAFEQIWSGISVDVLPLYSAREMEERFAGEPEAVSAEVPLDPVDLASALSFPASDPPAWHYGGPIHAEDTA